MSLFNFSKIFYKCGDKPTIETNQKNHTKLQNLIDKEIQLDGIL